MTEDEIVDGIAPIHRQELGASLGDGEEQGSLDMPQFMGQRVGQLSH